MYILKIYICQAPAADICEKDQYLRSRALKNCTSLGT
jgi:hypothetical protein